MTEPPEFKRLRAEKQELLEGMGMAVAAWSAMEGGLEQTFSLLAFNQPFEIVAGVIFYSPTNFETRLRLVDDMIAFRLQEKSELALAWSTIKGRIQRKQKVRNAIAHGSIVTSGDQMRLTPAFGDHLRWRLAKGKTGMKGIDIRQFSDAVWRLSSTVVAYNHALGTLLSSHAKSAGDNPSE